MGSDTRLSYFNDIEQNGVLCQQIAAVADCIQKTFYIRNARLGIHFLGIGYFPDNTKSYPLSHFVDKLEQLTYTANIKNDCTAIFNYLIKLSKKGNTGQYIKGNMSGFSKGKAYICTFNTFNNQFNIQEFHIGNFVDSENDKTPFPSKRGEAIKEINTRIENKSQVQPWDIGGPVEILEIDKHNSFNFIQKNENTFSGAKDELVYCFNNDIKKINGTLIDPPKIVKYRL
ncbi:MAG: hypothetical protein A3J83_03595 [Elusimicrobia bacterium RIFOXYA2_FULL_40_6]|nr:MAG: hypothetical protein A3J83_03595 [Elusimicrobia bacterium RIFOXYA2_FULL_40_6]